MPPVLNSLVETQLRNGRREALPMLFAWIFGGNSEMRARLRAPFCFGGGAKSEAILT
jgi:hypothetical protein